MKKNDNDPAIKSLAEILEAVRRTESGDEKQQMIESLGRKQAEQVLRNRQIRSGPTKSPS